MNKHNCPECGLFMYIDWEKSMETGEIKYACPRDCRREERVLDIDATDCFWDEIDYQRFQDDPHWISILVRGSGFSKK